jgi:hypothetical protein
MFVRDHLGSDTFKRRGFFDFNSVIGLLDEHFSGRANRAHWIMLLLTFEVWHRQFIDRAPANSTPRLARAVL